MLKHYPLPPNKSEASPGNVIFFDTEAYYNPEIQYQACEFQRLRLGAAVAGRFENGCWTREKRCRFKTSQEFWDFVADRSHPKIPIWVFAHNIGYDLIISQFPELLDNDTFQIFDRSKDEKKTDYLGQSFTRSKGFICTDNPPVIISATHKDGWRVIFVDTFNYWTTSLSKIGEMVGQRKLVMPDRTDTDESWWTYCEGDVETLKAAVLGLVNWIKGENLGKFRFTAPSMAMAAFRHRFYTHKILCHNNTTLRTLERQSYYGGRLECFYIGRVEEKIFELDVTSLYPSVMKGNLYPCRVIDWQHPTTHMRLRTPDIQLNTLATVKLKTQEGFPKRDARIGTIYPTGEYWTTLCGPELMRAKEHGCIQEVRAWATFELAPIFDSFVDFFWEYRLACQREGLELQSNLAKLLMNGLYGKFGQKTNSWTDRPDIKITPQEYHWVEMSEGDNSVELYRRVGKCVQQWTGKQEHPYAFPSIAAYVTAYAREYMRALRNVAGVDNVYYLVTDAIFCNATGYRNLANSDCIAEGSLGNLRVKHEAESGEFEALHHYRIGEHKVAGSKKKSALAMPDGSFMELQFESLDRALKRVPDGSVHIKPVRKVYRKDYTRGVLSESGWVKPLTLQEE